MSNDYFFAPDLVGEIQIPEKGMVSRTLQNDDHSKIVLFGFAAGGGMRDHRAAMPVILHFLSGEGILIAGGDRLDVGPGAFSRMSAQLSHSIDARTPMVHAIGSAQGRARPVSGKTPKLRH